MRSVSRRLELFCFFMLVLLTPSSGSSADNANSLSPLRVRYHEQSPAG
jgi:hypothetical protein